MIVGIDIGTQSLKAVVVGDDLAVLGEGAVSYGVDYPRPGWAQQDPQSWDDALAPAIGAALSAAGIDPGDVTAIGVSGQLDGCVAVDDACEPLGPCLIWMDRRATASLPNLDADQFRGVTGQVPDAGHMAAKIRWLNHNAVGLEGARFHQPVSYIVERLTGESVFDHGLASTTMLYGLSTRDYDSSLLEAFEVRLESLPRIAHATDIAGRLGDRGAALCGLNKGTAVAVGTGDDFATPLGAGIVGPGHGVCVIGTAEVVGALSKDMVLDGDGLVETHGYVNDCYFVENPGWLSGGAMTWLCGLIGVASFDELDDIAADAAPGSDGVLFLPTLSGAMAPTWNASATGTINGLTAAHGRSHVARAAMEGCAFAMRDVIDRIDALGVPIESVVLLGGGSRSALWSRIRADVLDRPVDVSSRADTCPLGAAMMAAVASGSVADLDTCARLVAGRRERIEPDPAHRDAMDAAYAAYRELFTALTPVWR